MLLSNYASCVLFTVYPRVGGSPSASENDNRFFLSAPHPHEGYIIIFKSRPESTRILPETRFTEFTALSVDLRVGIFQAASVTDDIFLTYDIKIIKYHLSFLLFIYDILRRITTFYQRRSVFFVMAHK